MHTKNTYAIEILVAFISNNKVNHSTISGEVLKKDNPDGREYLERDGKLPLETTRRTSNRIEKFLEDDIVRTFAIYKTKEISRND